MWIQDFVACAFSAADEVGIFALLAKGQRTATDIADALRLDSDSVLAVCRALAGLGGLTTHNNTFALTSFTRSCWVKQTPTYRGREFDRHRDWPQHKRIVETLELGWSPIDDGDIPFADGWLDGSVDPESASCFTRVMHSMAFAPSLSASRCPAIVGSRLLDIGGGSGVFSAAWLAHHPKSRATVVDLAPVCAASKRILEKYESGARVEYCPCNLFRDPWPEGADLMWISNVLHDWPLEKCHLILKNAYSSLPQGGCLFIHEQLLNPDRCTPSTTALYNLLMRMNFKGQQFTKQELFELVAQSGFVDPTVVYTYANWTVIKAQKT